MEEGNYESRLNRGIEAVREYATEQEICDIYREVFGEYRDPGYF